MVRGQLLSRSPQVWPSRLNLLPTQPQCVSGRHKRPHQAQGTTRPSPAGMGRTAMASTGASAQSRALRNEQRSGASNASDGDRNRHKQTKKAHLLRLLGPTLSYEAPSLAPATARGRRRQLMQTSQCVAPLHRPHVLCCVPLLTPVALWLVLHRAQVLMTRTGQTLGAYSLPRQFPLLAHAARQRGGSASSPSTTRQSRGLTSRLAQVSTHQAAGSRNTVHWPYGTTLPPSLRPIQPKASRDTAQQEPQLHRRQQGCAAKALRQQSTHHH